MPADRDWSANFALRRHGSSERRRNSLARQEWSNSTESLRIGSHGGKACIRGVRVTVGMVVGQIGAGHSIEAVLADYPYLDREDILQALATRRGSPKSVKSFRSANEAALT
jgi:uncharacterized protein (DUF433 family)